MLRSKVNPFQIDTNLIPFVHAYRLERELGMAITSFSWVHRFLSNFHDCEIDMDGVVYRSVEHAYQAAKTLSEREREWVRKCIKAGEAKRMGRQVTVREDWDEVKIDIMRSLVEQKFTRHIKLGDRLMDTGEQSLEEGNAWGDTFWGVCNGVGENHLGKILMEVREKIKRERKQNRV